jgi:crotonobetainyl-CoA:carnitine CoA-transferase CaiB-like acyl-CoA transferase
MSIKLRELSIQVSGPLKGVRIIDLTTVLFGSYATQQLGDLGADVVKVEFPEGERGVGGDVMRGTGAVPSQDLRDLGPIFMSLNRNKRSASLDLRKADQMAALKVLIADADVFTASVRYEGLKRLGLGYEDLRAINPRLIYVHAAGFDSDGPSAGEPAYDDLIQAGSGFADLLNRTDENPEPRYIPSLIADKIAGHFMAQATLAALFHRERTGEGQFVEVPMLECVTSFNLVEHLFGHVYDPPTGPWSYIRVTNPNRRPYRTKDGYVGLLAYTMKQWRALFTLVGEGERFSADPRFTDYPTLTQHVKELYAWVGEITTTKTTDEWIGLLKPLQIPVIRVNRLDDLMTDPQLEAVGFFEQYRHPDAGVYTVTRHPVKYSSSPASIRRHPPRLGEHTEEILAEARALSPKRRRTEAGV